MEQDQMLSQELDLIRILILKSLIIKIQAY